MQQTSEAAEKGLVPIILSKTKGIVKYGNEIY